MTTDTHKKPASGDVGRAPFDYESILNEAERRFRRHCMSIRGQQITVQDGLDFWTALVAHERALRYRDELEKGHE